MKDEEKSKEIETLITKWSTLTWKEQNEVMHLAAQPAGPTGDRQFNFVNYRDAIIKRCLKEWNITANQKPVPVTPQSIDQLPGPVVTNLYQKFEKMLDYFLAVLNKNRPCTMVHSYKHHTSMMNW